MPARGLLYVAATMKKQSARLAVKGETIRLISTISLEAVAGGIVAQSVPLSACVTKIPAACTQHTTNPACF